jgi:dienelactone hydrolase
VIEEAALSLTTGGVNMRRLSTAAVLALLMMAHSLTAAPDADDLAAKLREGAAKWKYADPDATVYAPLRQELREANVRETKAWQALTDRTGWEKHQNSRIDALNASLGTFPEPPRDLKVRVRKTLTGEGYRIDNLTFESRPGLVVTANLYRPEKPGKAMPGILICHSHHAPKTQGELQDMGAMWARAGCLVLVMDMAGHGERRDHPFRTAADYPKPYLIGRQDYYFRYNLAIQLQTIGDSLMGWMVWDLQRGVDLLLSRPGIDARKIILLGAVAGGGDPAAVTAALDQRIAAAAPFNFGGPQPETRYPLSDDEMNFNYAGSGSWESTRNLARSAKDGFLPWVIVGAIAPRRHLYGHEFAWDQKRDPVWKRLEKIHGWYGHPEHLASVHGSGSVRGKPPESTHCTNIGPVHRKGIHEALKKWFGIEPAKEATSRRPAQELLCLEAGERPRPIHVLAADIGAARAEKARTRLAALKTEERRKSLRTAWAKLLGDVNPSAILRTFTEPAMNLPDGVQMTRIGLRGREWVSTLLLVPPHKGRVSVVVAFGQGGNKAFLQHRSPEITALLRAGSAVALVELGGLSSQPPGSNRGRVSSATGQASTALMLGAPMLGARLAELRQMLGVLRKRPEIDPKHISLWGDSFAPVNGPDTRVEVPLELPQPAQAEPLGSLLALLAALFEDDIESVRAGGGLVSYQALLESPFCHVPYDIVVPGALTTGDLADIVAALAPTPVRLERLVDGRNRIVPAKECERVYAVARLAYRQAKAAEKLRLAE